MLALANKHLVHEGSEGVFRPLTICAILDSVIDSTQGVPFLDTLDFAREIVNAVEDKKAEDILLLDLKSTADTRDYNIADYFVLCTGNSDRQIKALAENVRQAMKDKFGKLPVSIEGEGASGWVLMDYGDVIVHIFGEAEREYYNLEGLWRNANVLVTIP
jgi:ribosome-associated protein